MNTAFSKLLTGESMDREELAFCGFYEDGDEEVCMDCEMTQEEYNEENGYPSNQLTLHYIGGETYCLTCRDPEDDEEEDDEEEDELLAIN